MGDSPFPPLRAGIQWRLAGLAKLVRAVGVVSWLGGSFLVGLGAALGDLAQLSSSSAPDAVFWTDAGLILLAGTLVHGLAAHAFNDWEDWRSGADRQNRGILSGGSGAVPQGLLGRAHLEWTGALALGAAALITFYFARRSGPGTWLLWLVGAWSAVSYSLPPLRLAYRPFLGELVSGFPALITATAGTCYLLTGRLSWTVVVAGAVNGLFGLAWLMQHHLADIPADLAATPPKLTSPAWLYRWRLARGGPHARAEALLMAQLPAMAYFALATLCSAAAVSLPVAGPAFSAPAILGTAGLFLASRRQAEDVRGFIALEQALVILAFLESVCLAAGLALVR